MTQWVAVRTQFLWMRVPPQVWKKVGSGRLSGQTCDRDWSRIRNVIFTFTYACKYRSGVLLTCMDTCQGQECGLACSPFTMRAVVAEEWPVSHMSWARLGNENEKSLILIPGSLLCGSFVHQQSLDLNMCSFNTSGFVAGSLAFVYFLSNIKCC